MKGCIPEANLKGQGWETTLFTNLLVQTWGLRYFWKTGNIRKKVCWNRRLRLLCTLYIGVLRKFNLHFILMFWLRYYKMVPSLCKNWLLVSKITWGIRTISDKQWKVQKVEFWWATFVQKIICPKNTFLQIKHYIQKIYLTLLSTNCVKIHQITYVIFETISYFSQHNFSLFFLAQTLHTFCRSSSSECKFSYILLLGLKFTKFLMWFFKQNFSFSSKFRSFCSVMRDNSSVPF